MNIRISLLLLFTISLLCSYGCGGGGGDSSNPAAPAPTTILQGSVDTAAINPAKAPSLKGQANPLNLKIRIDGITEPKSLDGAGQFTIVVANSYLTGSVLQFDVINSLGEVLMSLQQEGITPDSTNGKTVSQVNATTTAIVSLRQENPNFSLTFLNAKVADPGFQNLLNAIKTVLNSAGTGATLSQTAVRSATASATTALEPAAQQVRFSGTVDTAAINAAKVPSLRGQIDATKLAVHIAGTAVQSTVQADGTFSVSSTSAPAASTTLEVRNSGGTVLMAYFVPGATLGFTYGNLAIDATSTAKVALIRKYPELSLTKLNTFFQSVGATPLVQAIVAYLGSGGTGGIFSDATVDSALITARELFTTGEESIRQAYAAIIGIMTNNDLTDQQRVDQFMGHISPTFTDIGGTPNYAQLESYTLSRFQRYFIYSYDFSPQSFSVVATDTIRVTTNMFIDVERKPGATGGVLAATITVTPTPVITWKFDGTTWKIQTGLPYKSNEISI